MPATFDCATYNARSLLGIPRQVELQEALKTIKWDVIALNELRLRGEGSLTFLESKDVLFWSGHKQLSQHDVGFLIKEQYANQAVFSPHSAICATLSLPDAKIYMVAGYGPTSASTDEEYDEFLATLDVMLTRTPKGFSPILLGDFNAKVSQDESNRDIAGLATIHDGNDRGKALLELCRAHNLRLWSTFLEKRAKRLWTWRSPNGVTRNQIDYIADRRHLAVKDVSVLNNFVYNSDHRMIRMQVWRNNLKQTKSYNRIWSVWIGRTITIDALPC